MKKFLTALAALVGLSTLITPAAEAAPHNTIVVAIPGGANSLAAIPDAMPHGGYTKPIVRNLHARGIQATTASYDAVPFAVLPYNIATARGKSLVSHKIARIAAQHPHATISLVGYSEGADIASDLTEDIAHGHGPIPENRLGKVALLSNPHNGPASAHHSGTQTHGRGVLGPAHSYGVATDRVLNVCNRGDLVCDSAFIPGMSNHADAFTSLSPLTGPGKATIRDGQYAATHAIPLALGFNQHTTSYVGSINPIVDFLSH